ncbi:restriction endonuclease [Microbacterium esteraromaticum]|uniref:restriction endonuclease n=1 Tax=Microbacterium esteraromaticum TaxID=57043 RepID=UPI0030A7C49E
MSTVAKGIIDGVKDEAEVFARRHDAPSDQEIAEQAAVVAARRIPMPSMWDGALWKILLSSSIGIAVVMGIAYTAAFDGVGGFTSFAMSTFFVFILMIVPSLMIAGGAWGKKPKLAEAQRADVRQAFVLAANRHLVVRQQEEAARAEAERMERLLSRPSAPPAPQPYGVSPEGAERIVEAWMRHLGALDAEVTRYTADGGIDVASASWIAQVKHHQGVIGVAAIRELAGVAAIDGRSALFFTSTGYAEGAVDFADKAGMGLFVYSAEDGTLAARNDVAELLAKKGLFGV